MIKLMRLLLIMNVKMMRMINDPLSHYANVKCQFQMKYLETFQQVCRGLQTASGLRQAVCLAQHDAATFSLIPHIQRDRVLSTVSRILYKCV